MTTDVSRRPDLCRSDDRRLTVPVSASRPSKAASADFDHPAICQSCHTEDLTTTNGAVEAGAYWRCRRCGQQWDAARLKAVASYADWLLHHPAYRQSSGDPRHRSEVRV